MFKKVTKVVKSIWRAHFVYCIWYGRGICEVAYDDSYGYTMLNCEIPILS